MKNLVKKTNEYIKTLDAWDMGVIKICLLSFGVLAGLTVSKEDKAKTAAVAGTVCALTYVPIMADFIKFMAENDKEETPADELFGDEEIELI